MCLYKTHWFPKIAWKPIKCYKVVERCNDSSFYTIHTHCAYTLNEPIKNSYSWFGLFKRKLTGEVVHAYKTKSTASWTTYGISDSVLECIIPKFTLYWLGIGDEIGARKMIPIRFVKPEYQTII